MHVSRIFYSKVIYFFVFFCFIFISRSVALPADTLSYQSYIANDGVYTYQAVTNDPLSVRIYTLDNGLKVYLSKNDRKPSIQTYIAINSGASSDPADATGLAHYLEHIMFKGTSKMGTLNWPKEEVLLDSLETMFEYYGTLTDPAARKSYYAKIDQLSQQAARYAIPNEYDKLIGEIGASGTNACTNYDETVYINSIPSNQLENWLEIEANRFSEIVPRLFHTELEAVYEEKNRMTDMRQAYQKLIGALFENHPYGKQTVIGTIDHLKNPSITAIKNYFDKYYVPNNAAIILSGDLKYDSTIRLIDRYFSSWQKGKEVKQAQYKAEKVIQEPIEREVYGPSSESVTLAYRLPSPDKKDYLKAQMINMILDSQIGLIPLNLNQQQKVQGAGAQLSTMEDYSLQTFYGMPIQGQSLEDVASLLQEQLKLIKQGQFEDWLPAVLVADLKKNEMGQMTSNRYRAQSMLTSFTRHLSRKQQLEELRYLAQLDKQEIVRFARKIYGDNYVALYKRRGEADLPKVEKPAISKVTLNKDTASVFYHDIVDNEVKPIQPVFLNYEKDIKRVAVRDDVDLLYVENDLNDLFSLTFEIEKGGNNDPELRLAASYLDYLGTESLTSEALRKELFKLGCDFGVYVNGDHTSVYINGLDEHMEEAVSLVLDLISNPKADSDALEKLKQRILKSRTNAKQSEKAISKKLRRYVKYGPPNSQMQDFLSEEELQAITAEQLIGRLQELPGLEQYISYYGPRKAKTISGLLGEVIGDKRLNKVAEDPEYTLKEVSQKVVFWTDYDKVQADIYVYARGSEFDKERMAEISLYNAYFGGGMSSVMFQELREARGLAYTVNAGYRTASQQDGFDYYSAYMGTQADKIPEVLPAMLNLIETMPHSEIGLKTARQSLVNDIRTQRITGYSIISRYIQARNLGINYDIRQDLYRELNELTYKDLREFHRQYIQDRPAALMVFGSKERIDFTALKSYGPVRELTLKELFGY